MLQKILTWNQPLGIAECPYLHRWVLNLGLFSVRLHKWSASDDLRAMHDHPFHFITFVLKGKYIDISPGKIELLPRWSIRFRKAKHTHSVKIVDKPTWTLLLCGPELRKWGFFPGGKFTRKDKYFKKYGHHPCE